MTPELLYALIALVSVGAVIGLIRYASNKQLKGGADGIKKRLDGETAAEPRSSAAPEPARDDQAESTTAAVEGADETDKEPETEDISPRELAPESAGDQSVSDDLPEPEEIDEVDEPDPVDELDAPDEVDEPADEPTSESDRLKAGLSKTRGGFVAKLGRLFSKKKIDDDVIDELEDVLLTADIGPKTADRLFTEIKSELTRSELADPDAIWAKVREHSANILKVDTPQLDFASTKPFVLLTIGVNGVGKTTTIGKVAAKLSRAGKKVLLAAGDTFRAAAVEQLEVWGERAGATVVKGKPNSDPSSVIFDAIKKGVDEGYDVVIADTAGRLHTKTELMEELQKVGRVCGKALEGAPHETWLVLDSTTGQNAIQQAKLFREAVEITGLILTKLDGTAKGGVVLGICDEMTLPVRYIGIGEQVDDLREFDPDAFVDALYQEEEAA